jgi:purine-binding chemotaxis protein CheW
VPSRTRTNQYLTFKLGLETYAFDVANAREIVECGCVTQIPKTPAWIRGVINLRGNVMPVLDMKLKFGMGRTEQAINTCVIVVESALEGEPFIVGVLADSVQEVFDLEDSHIERAPKFGARIATQYVRGMGRRGNELFIILDAEQIFSEEDMEQMQRTADGAPSACSEKESARTADASDASETHF